MSLNLQSGRGTYQIEGIVGLTLELLLAGLETLIGMFEIAIDKGLVLVEAERHVECRVSLRHGTGGERSGGI